MNSAVRGGNSLLSSCKCCRPSCSVPMLQNQHNLSISCTFRTKVLCLWLLQFHGPQVSPPEYDTGAHVCLRRFFFPELENSCRTDRKREAAAVTDRVFT